MGFIFVLAYQHVGTHLTQPRVILPLRSAVPSGADVPLPLAAITRLLELGLLKTSYLEATPELLEEMGDSPFTALEPDDISDSMIFGRLQSAIDTPYESCVWLKLTTN